ncbi:EF-hand domain-containing protein [Luteimonas sp. Y-2-2-4F]|nr:EF-hand domain-containing protein [Luteimonas sp. Y-2-2-4F]MCD9031124.1 EF-hand domain-containing protein [Luteimonas sp. Y-2-2-4F]
MTRSSAIAIATALLLPAVAAAQVQTQPLPPAGTAPERASAQTAQTGIVTFGDPGEQQVIVRSYEPDGAAGDAYRISFEALDTDGDGVISRSEAAAHPRLSHEFRGVDADGDGRLTREELRGWIR